MIPVPPRHRGRELLDDPAVVAASPREVAASFAEIRRLNRLAGGTRAVRRALQPLLPAGEARVLDVGTGTADTPLALLAWAARVGRPLHLTGLDISPTLLTEARRLVGNAPVTLVEGDARSLPWPDGAFDVAVSLGVLHHFSEAEASGVLREMARVSRRGIVVVDLRRSYPMYWLARIALRLLTRNRFTRNDGVLSVLRAYTPEELAMLARDAGLQAVSVRTVLPGLVTLTAGSEARRQTLPPDPRALSRSPRTRTTKGGGDGPGPDLSTLVSAYTRTRAACWQR
jgi:ubiquinone/menaquinone biosynthesis C-methylase UbiE